MSETLKPYPEGFNHKGCTTEQRLWVRRRDSDDMGHPENCRCQFHLYTTENGMKQCPVKLNSELPRVNVEIHHIFPKGLERKAVKDGTRLPPHAGEDPLNLIALCSGDSKSIGHHDLMSPQMIIAKQTYPYDADSYTRSLSLVTEGTEAGLHMYNLEYDGMLKMVARARTEEFKRQFPNDKFPYTRNKEGKTSLPHNGTVFDTHIA